MIRNTISFVINSQRSRFSNALNERDQRDEINQIDATNAMNPIITINLSREMLFNMLSHWDSTNSMKAINSKNSINSMNPTNTTTMNKESYNIMDVPKISSLDVL